MENKIKLVQSPVIEHELKKAGKQVTDRIAKLDLKNQVATIDSVKFLKDTRAELNKEFKNFEDDRKSIKNKLFEPYNEFESLYKDEITIKYKEADELLKEKINTVEIQVKKDRKQEIESYFIELCQSYKIDFVSFENVGIEIKLSDSMKSYKEKCNEFIERIVDDIELIGTLEFEAEIMAEYKVTLNATKAIKDIQDRKERERQEQERIRLQEKNNRIAKLKAIGMQYDDMTKSYSYNDDIYMSEDKIMSFEKGDFSLKVVELEEKIKSIKKAEQAKIEDEKKEKKPEPSKEEIKETKKEPLQAPVVEEKQERLSAEFRVYGTMPELKALGAYMKENGLKYENL